MARFVFDVPVEAGTDLRSRRLSTRRARLERLSANWFPPLQLTPQSQHIGEHTPLGESDRWLFTAYGKPVHNNRITFPWRSTRRQAKAETVRLHDLRHLFASGLIAQGCDVVTVQRASVLRPRRRR